MILVPDLISNIHSKVQDYLCCWIHHNMSKLSFSCELPEATTSLVAVCPRCSQGPNVSACCPSTLLSKEGSVAYSAPRLWSPLICSSLLHLYHRGITFCVQLVVSIFIFQRFVLLGSSTVSNGAQVGLSLPNKRFATIPQKEYSFPQLNKQNRFPASYLFILGKRNLFLDITCPCTIEMNV